MANGALPHRGYLSMVKESAWGTNPATGYVSTPIASENLQTKVAYNFVKSIHTSRAGSNIKVPMGVTAGGTVTFEADVEGILGLCLKGILSAETTVDNGSGNGGNHTFVEADTVPSFSILVNRDTQPSSTNIWQYVGCTVDKLSLSAAEGQLLKAVATITAKNGTPSATAAAPTYTTQNPLVYHTGTFTVGGSSVNVKSFQLDITSGNYSKRGAIGSKYIQQQQPGVIQVTGTIEAYFDDMSLINDYLNGTDAAIVLELDGTALGTSTRKMAVTIPVAQFTGDTPVLAGPATETMLKLPFTAWLSGSGSPNNLCQVLLVNSQRTAY